MRPSRLTLLLAGAVVLFSSACSTGTTPANPEPVDLSGTSWVLLELGGETPVGDTSVTIAFTEDGQIAGSTGCNRFGGSFTTDGNTISLESGAMTMMACADDVMAQERTYLDAITAASTFAVADEQLTLEGDDGAALALFEAQSQELVGTNWTVVMYNDGASAVTSAITGSEATLAFGDDGTISGTGGCNQFSGGFTTGEGTITVDEVAITQMACAEPDGVMEQESAITTALQSAATFTVEGDTLNIRTADDQTALELKRA